jgi:cysteinyl-tRNA synthetase
MQSMPLKVYNTLTRQKEEFTPLQDGYVGMYVCGPTVYGHSHLGHGKSYVSFDVIVRYLRYLGYRVQYVQNITDVGHLLGDAFEGEDRVLMQSRLEHKHPMQIAEEYTRSYFEDMDQLNVLRPDISPRATGHVGEQIEIIQQLIRKGFAYEANGSVYFDVHRFPGYGKLSGRDVDEMEAGARVELKTEKKHPADFALWKKAEPEHIMRWNSPWGVGFPGWHVECSAMSMKYLGATLDVHGGGLENQFPHHECEIAQSEGVTGKPFVKYWLHNNMVTVNGQKMGKSLNNFTTLKQSFGKWKPQVVRFFILQSHYRSTLDFSDEAIDAAATGLLRLANTMAMLRERTPGRNAPPSSTSIDLPLYKKSFLEAMNDDFNTPQAIASLFDLAREVNSRLGNNGLLEAGEALAIIDLFDELAGKILGIDLSVTSHRSSLEGDLMKLIVKLRETLRKEKMWKLSDTIRDSLGDLGITLEDKSEGTSWRRSSSHLKNE